MCFRVLVSKEGPDFVAHALEADIIGHGETPDEALDELAEALSCQITFALQKGDHSLIFRDAPQEVLKKWEQARDSRTFSDVQESHRGKPGLKRSASIRPGPKAEYLVYSERDLKALRNNKLELVGA